MENKLETFLTAVVVTLGLVILQHSINPDATANGASDNNVLDMPSQASLVTHD
ncbi:hypothetical protein [Leptothoe spongobia]|uniref:Uncharacterized protein n=1 Tax=Leptothoe spongobia TAU-MAC 1115 TaxID=1967444 RepID=A0A947DI37_9CYAN|nr:hypothetical protein [Leptothoe spongobia]MBT9317587.1 hypothetical protein [Leptothoe spongobia TAU-MAC 1115]